MSQELIDLETFRDAARASVSIDILRRLMGAAERALETYHSDWARNRGRAVKKTSFRKGEEFGTYTALLFMMYRLNREDLRRAGIRDLVVLPSAVITSQLHFTILETLSKSGRLTAFGRGDESGEFVGRLAGETLIHWEPSRVKVVEAVSEVTLSKSSPLAKAHKAAHPGGEQLRPMAFRSA